MSIPRVLVAGLRGGSGKTLVSLGLSTAWRKQGQRVACFKKGPDYIDAAWLSAAADRPCRNLDLFLMTPEAVTRSFVRSTEAADVAVIEGNRGLFDGMDGAGTYSTAELAKLLRCPVVLIADCTKATRTVAAIVLGCQRLDPDLGIGGVVLNQTAGARHESVLREAIEEICGLPVVGAVPKIRQQLFPERHLGLVPPQEHEEFASDLQRVVEVAERHLDLEGIRRLAQGAPVIDSRAGAAIECAAQPGAFRIGVFRDAAFQFYYPENLEALMSEGATLVEISPLCDAEVPDVDALYIGGGFPETAAPSLAGNKPFLGSVRRGIEDGLPVYAECGGAVFLGENLLIDQQQFAMAGVLPLSFVFHAKPQGHGYTMLETVGSNPFFTVGQSIRGHEFHYTCVEAGSGKGLSFAFEVRRGVGFGGQRDGACYRNVLASYTHVHALGTPSWASSIVRAAAQYKLSRSQPDGNGCDLRASAACVVGD
jgi:cobyrinic acid a,c-diamide synthase